MRYRKLLIIGAFLIAFLGACGTLLRYAEAEQTLPTTPQSEIKDRSRTDIAFEGPGNPANGVEDLKRIYKYIAFYRSKHNGQYPAQTSDVLREISSLPGVDSPETHAAAVSALVNPDSRYSDHPAWRANPDHYSPYGITNKRPDGSLVGSAKLSGAKDVLAYTDLYLHEKVGKTDVFLSGFYLVLWDDGSVEKVSYDRMLNAPSAPGADTFVIAFPGQAGVPYDAITYEEYWANLSASSLPLFANFISADKESADKEKVIRENGGFEGLFTLSNLLNQFIVRESMWNIFSPAQEEFSLPEVQSGAQRLGLPLQVRKLSLHELQQLNVPALFLTSDDKRIVTLSTLDEQEAMVIDRGMTRIVSRELLAKRYGGEVLVASTSSLPTVPAVLAENPLRKIEVKNLDEAIPQQVTIHNRGNAPLELQIERPIPGVTEATLSSDTVAPGASATLSLQMKWRKILKGDSQNVLVYLKTNDPRRPRLPLGFLLRAPQTP